MPRPEKQTADYFPHKTNTSGKKTLFILERKWGNNGYAFWFKLLEILGDSEGHFYDCNNSDEWEFLLARMLVDEDTAILILKELAILGAIDQELYEKKIIWCQNLVNNLAALYERRKSPLPQKPSTVSANINPESKAVPMVNDDLITYFEQVTGHTLIAPQLDIVGDWMKTYPEQWIRNAIDEAKAFEATTPVPYIGSILERWTKDGEPKKTKRPATNQPKSTTDEDREGGLDRPLS